jgi:hypothetical protein
MSDDQLVIPPPRTDRPPLHSNAFDVAQGSNTQLKPLFPYLHRCAVTITARQTLVNAARAA